MYQVLIYLKDHSAFYTIPCSDLNTAKRQKARIEKDGVYLGERISHVAIKEGV